MTEAIVLDVALVVLLVGYLVYGLRNGLTRSAAVIAGVVAGLVAAWVLVPLVGSWIPYPFVRPFAAVVLALGLVAAGHALGSFVGRMLRRGVAATPLGWLDRLLGAVIAVVVAGLVASVLAGSVAPLGVPLLSRAIAGSSVLRTISTITPDPVEAWLAQARAFVVDRGIPTITGAIGGARPVIPSLDTGSATLTAAAQSVVRITGNAWACGVAQSGTGFVVSDDRVITNAHVLAGVTDPLVEAPDGQVITGTVVYFDPIDDLAVIAAPGLTAPALTLVPTIAVGADAAVQGYPFGGPFSSLAARVMTVSMAGVRDIYGASTNPREVYTLAAEVREGNSGGPLLTLDGTVAGVVFARDGEDPLVGYAMTMTELAPVAAEAETLTNAISTGECIG